MYTFLVIVKIMILPTQEVHEFRAWSTVQYSQPLCQERADELAESISEFVENNMPARVKTQAGCILQPTRPT